MEKRILTVGDLKELLKYSDDGETLVLKLDDEYLECTGASSSGGGTVTILWFEEKDKISAVLDHMNERTLEERIQTLKDAGIIDENNKLAEKYRCKRR